MKESNAPAVGRTPFQKWLDKYQGILYLIPWIIGFVVFKAVPLRSVAVLQLHRYELLQERHPVRWSGQLHHGLYHHQDHQGAAHHLQVRFHHRAAEAGLCALFIAYILNFKIACVNLFRTVYYIPSILGGSVAIAVLWKAVFSVDGLLNTVLRAVTFGLVQGPEWLSDPSYALWIICFLRIWQFGSAMVLFLAL